MGQARRTILVDVFDNDDQSVGFNLTGYGVKGDEIRCAKDGKHEMHHDDAHEITFEINNRSTKDLCFPSDGSRAMWVSANDRDCPTSTPAPHSEFPQSARKVSDDREQLTVRNLDSQKGRYKFALNFTDPADREQKLIEQFDPIWNNGNGGSRT